MSWLRLLLILCLLVGGGVLCFRVPYTARAELNGMSYSTDMPEETAFFEPPEKPKVAHFGGRLSPYINESTVKMTAEVNRPKLFGRVAMVVVSCFFFFGLVGLVVDRHRPRGMDVAYSLGLSLGLIVATVLSHLAAVQWQQPSSFLWFSYFWTGGFVLAFIITLLIRRRYGSTF